MGRLPRTSKTCAMNLRHHLYDLDPKATIEYHPHGHRGPVELRPFTAEELEAARKGYRATLLEWCQVDSVGAGLWMLANKAHKNGEDPEKFREATGHPLTLHRVNLAEYADPCAYCSECRAG